MKRLIIIVEGQTEEEFVKEVLCPFFYEHKIYAVTPIKIATSKVAKGGFVNYAHLKNDAARYLHEPDTVVTMFVDFFRIPTSLPNYDACMSSNNTADNKIICLEQAIGKDINNAGFIPYIQKHEFEALLFSSNTGFEELYDKNVFSRTNEIVKAHPDPEEINTRAEYAPSKRLTAIMKDYDKVADGNLIALEIGIDSILEKCARFRNWIDTIIKTMQA